MIDYYSTKDLYISSSFTKKFEFRIKIGELNFKTAPQKNSSSSVIVLLDGYPLSGSRGIGHLPSNSHSP